MDNRTQRNDGPVNDDAAIEWSEGESELHPAGTFRMKFVEFCKPEDDQYGRVHLIFESRKKKTNGEKFKLRRKVTPTLHAQGSLRPIVIAMGADGNKLDKHTFRLSVFLNTEVLVTIIHEARQDGAGTFAKISAITPLPVEDEDDEPIRPRTVAEPQRELAGVAASPARPDFDSDDE